MSCVIRRIAEQRGHRRLFDNGGFGFDDCSPMSLMSFSVEAGASFRLSYLSNQNAWHAVHTSILMGALRCASSVMEVMSVAQFGHFMAGAIIGGGQISA